MQPPLATPSCDRRSSCKGFSLIEAAIVLGIVGLVIGGIWVASSAVLENRRQARALEIFFMATENFRKLYQGQSVGGGVGIGNGVEPVLSAIIFPPDAMNGTTTINPWGGTISLGVDANDVMQFEITGMSVAACVSVAPKLYAAISNQSAFELTGMQPVLTIVSLEDASTPALAAVACQNAYDLTSSTALVGLLVTFRR